MKVEQVLINAVILINVLQTFCDVGIDSVNVEIPQACYERSLKMAEVL